MVVVQPLPDVAALAVQDATGTFVVLLVPQVVVTHELALVAADGEQFCTATLVVLLVLQVVVV